MAIQLIIKGNVAQAHEAARGYGISLNQAHQASERFNETLARCADDYRGQVTRWFCAQPIEAPYPIGSLLWFGDYHGKA